MRLTAEKAGELVGGVGLQEERASIRFQAEGFVHTASVDGVGVPDNDRASLLFREQAFEMKIEGFGQGHAQRKHPYLERMVHRPDRHNPGRRSEEQKRRPCADRFGWRISESNR